MPPEKPTVASHSQGRASIPKSTPYSASYQKRTPPPPKNPPRISKKTVILLSIFILIIIPLSLLIFSSIVNRDSQTDLQNQTIPSDEKVLATVGDHEIRISDVQSAAREQYTDEAINSDVLRLFLDIQIEKVILDKAAEEMNLVVTDEQITTYLEKETQNPSSSTVERQTARYNLIKEAVIQSLTTTKEAYVIGFWIPPDDYGLPLTEERLTIARQQRTDGQEALQEAENRLANDENPYEVALALYEQYPSLQSILTLNGGYINDPENERFFANPQVYTTNEENSSNPIYEAVFSLQPDAIEQVIEPDVGSYAVIQVVGSSDGTYTTYNDWLQAKKNETVVIHKNI